MFRSLVAISALSFLAPLSADESANRIYLSSGVSCRNTEVKSEDGSSCQANGVYPFVELGFDHTKANSIYWGLNLGLAVGKRKIAIKDNENLADEEDGIDSDEEISIDDLNSLGLDGELRLGYTFKHSKRALLITPFVGYGSFGEVFDVEDSSIGYGAQYLAVGLRNSYKCSQTWDIDCNLKVLRTFNETLLAKADGAEVRMHLDGGHWQFGAELPLRYYPTASRTVDISFVPFISFWSDMGDKKPLSTFDMDDERVSEQTNNRYKWSSWALGLGVQIGKKF